MDVFKGLVEGYDFHEEFCLFLQLFLTSTEFTCNIPIIVILDPKLLPIRSLLNHPQNLINPTNHRPHNFIDKIPIQTSTQICPLFNQNFNNIFISITINLNNF